MKLAIRNAVATRKYLVGPKKKTAVLQIGIPSQVPGVNKDWKCPFYISNIGLEEIKYAWGVDAVQSLMLAFQGARFYLLKSGVEFSWDAGEDGHCGIPRYVTYSFGVKIEEHLNNMLDRELERIIKSRGKCLHKSRLKKRAARRKKQS